MSFLNYKKSDTLDGTLDMLLLGEQINADSIITTDFRGINMTGDEFVLIFAQAPSASEQSQCDAIVGAHSGLLKYQDNLVDQIKNKRDNEMLERTVLAEYPSESGKYFSCTPHSQNQWLEIAILDSRGIITYPFTIYAHNERSSHTLTSSADLTNFLDVIFTAVHAERARARVYIDDVIDSETELLSEENAKTYTEL